MAVKQIAHPSIEERRANGRRPLRRPTCARPLSGLPPATQRGSSRLADGNARSTAKLGTSTRSQAVSRARELGSWKGKDQPLLPWDVIQLRSAEMEAARW